MNYGEVKAQFQGALNRRDITPSQVAMYVKNACQRAQRLLRVPASEQVVVFEIDQGFTTLAIPGDYLKLVSLTTQHGHELERVDLQTALRYSQYEGCPRFFSRHATGLVIGPKPKVGDLLTMVYQADLSELNADTDENWLTQTAPDVIVSGALAAACKFFVDPRAEGYEADFTRDITDLNIQAADDELTNAALTPAYHMTFWED
jgi:hypothetical protein